MRVSLCISEVMGAFERQSLSPLIHCSPLTPFWPKVGSVAQGGRAPLLGYLWFVRVCRRPVPPKWKQDQEGQWHHQRQAKLRLQRQQLVRAEPGRLLAWRAVLGALQSQVEPCWLPRSSVLVLCWMMGPMLALFDNRAACILCMPPHWYGRYSVGACGCWALIWQP